MAMRGLEGEVLLNSLRQLIFSFEPYIREAGSADQAEETLLHLEENDENFHKLVTFFMHVKKKKRIVLIFIIKSSFVKMVHKL
jgi:hypothetical protein